MGIAVGTFCKFFMRLTAISVFAASLAVFYFKWSADAREVNAFGEELPEDGQLLQTDDGRFFLIESGQQDETQVLFAHGTAAWSGLWRPTLTAVAAQGFRATAFDMPPFGWSEHPKDGDFSRLRQAKRIIALLESLDAPPVVVAHSVGAGPMAEAVLERPDLVKGLVVVAGAIALGSHEQPKRLPRPLRYDWFREYATAATASNPLLTAKFLRDFVHIKSVVTPEMVAMLQEPMTREGYTRAVSGWVPVLFQSPTNAMSTRAEHWRALDLPVVFIWGQQDTVTPVEQARELAGLVDGASLTILEGVGHIPQIEAPSEFQAALISALQAIELQMAAEVEE